MNSFLIKFSLEVSLDSEADEFLFAPERDVCDMVLWMELAILVSREAIFIVR